MRRWHRWNKDELEKKVLSYSCLHASSISIAHLVGCARSVVNMVYKKHGIKGDWKLGGAKANNCGWSTARTGRTSRRGYVLLLVPGHPRANRNGYVMEQVLVAEMELKRHLDRNEIVHHINRKRDDNSPENLQVMTQNEHMRIHSVEYHRQRRLNAISRP